MINSRNKNYFVIFIVLFFLISVLAISLYLRSFTKISLYRKAEIISQSPTNAVLTSDPSENWKIYTANDAGFSFKYPPDWIYEVQKMTIEIRRKEYNATLISAGRPLTEEYRRQNYLDLSAAPKTYGDFYLIYDTSEDFANVSNDILVEDLVKSYYSDVYSQEKVSFNNIQAIEVIYGCQSGCVSIVFKNNNTIFEVSSHPGPDIETLHKILSTMRLNK